MQLCAHIGRRLAALPVLFVLTRRDKPDRPAADALLADLAGRGVEVADLELGPLSPAELAAVARSVADLSQDAVDQVVRAADGNPLLAVESARALAAGRSATPQNLRAAVRAATGALPRPARDLAETLAAAGRELSAAELAALPLADRDAAEEAVLDTGLISRVGGGLRFRHALLAEAVRASLGEHGRRYEQLALAIETAAASPGQVAAEVAGHLHRAGRDDLAGPRWQLAARHARLLGTMPEAARFWAEAVRCEPDAVAPRLELAEAFGWLGQDAEFEREWQAALRRLPEEQQPVAWNRRGKVLRTVVCNPRAALAAYQRAWELLPADAPPSLRVDITLGAAWGESAGKIRSSSTWCWPRRPSMAGPNRICWMRSPGGRPMTSGSTACSRRSAASAPPRAGRACRCVRHARTWPGALATLRNNDQFRRLWKRSSDGGAADHNGGYCPARLQWWSYWPWGCTTMAGHRRLGRCVACRCQLLVLAVARPDVGCLDAGRPIASASVRPRRTGP